MTTSAYDTSWKAGNMILNRFCIDEDAGFELSDVSYLITPSFPRIKGTKNLFKQGKEILFLVSFFILINLEVTV